MLSLTPSNFGYPSENSQANYSPGEHRITLEEIGLVSKVMEAHDIESESTIVIKRFDGDTRVFDVLQASTVTGCIA